MLAELIPTAHGFELGGRFLRNLVADFTEADWRVRDAAGHDPRWLVGHLAATRGGVLTILGLRTEREPWEAAFGRGSSPAELPADLDMAPLLLAFHAAQPLFAARWETLSAEDLAKPLGRTLPDGTSTVGDALVFLAWHEAYHLGQVALLRRLAGKPGLA